MEGLGFWDRCFEIAEIIYKTPIIYFVYESVVVMILVYRLYGFKNKIINYMLFINTTFVLSHCSTSHYNWYVFGKFMHWSEFLDGTSIVLAVFSAINIAVFIKYFLQENKIIKFISTIPLTAIILSIVFAFFQNPPRWIEPVLAIVSIIQPFIQFAYMAIFTLYLLSNQIVRAVRWMLW